MEISLNIKENEQYVRSRCEGCADILIRSMKLGRDRQLSCFVVYIETAVSNMMLRDSLVGQMINRLWDMPQREILKCIKENSLGVSDVKELATMEEAMAAMLAGNAVMFLDRYDRAVKISSKGYPSRGVPKAESEKALRGSNEGFAESEKINAALIRKRIRSTDLKVEELTVGKRSQTMLALVYMEGLAYESLLNDIREKLQNFEIDGIFDTGMIEQLAEERWLSPFPQFETTERPDRAAMEILNGRIVLLCDNAPNALILPTTFSSFIQAGEDRYNRFEIVTFQRMIRYAAVILAMMFSGIYLAVINFHTQIVPTHLLLSFAEARQGVPFPSILEVLFMELAFELIREAGVRMPGPLGGTIGIVGGLIIGDAAVGANLVSPMAVVVVALSALSSFAIPDEEFSAPFRLLKYGFILLGGWFGIFGIVCGCYLVLGHLAGLTSFRIPYLMPFIGSGLKGYTKDRDGIFRGPLMRMRRRPVFAQRGERVRLRMGNEKHTGKGE